MAQRRSRSTSRARKSSGGGWTVKTSRRRKTSTKKKIKIARDLALFVLTAPSTVKGAFSNFENDRLKRVRNAQAKPGENAKLRGKIRDHKDTQTGTKAIAGKKRRTDRDAAAGQRQIDKGGRADARRSAHRQRQDTRRGGPVLPTQGGEPNTRWWDPSTKAKPVKGGGKGQPQLRPCNAPCEDGTPCQHMVRIADTCPAKHTPEDREHAAEQNRPARARRPASARQRPTGQGRPASKAPARKAAPRRPAAAGQRGQQGKPARPAGAGAGPQSQAVQQGFVRPEPTRPGRGEEEGPGDGRLIGED